MGDSKPSRTESISNAYRQRITDVEASEARDADELAEADTLSHDQHELTEEAKFVANPDVRKEATSEEEFLSPEDAAPEDAPEVEKPKATKKTAAKKS